MDDALSYLRLRLDAGERDFFIRLTPKASANRLGECMSASDGTVQVKAYVTAVPEKGKANAALLALLAKQLKLPKTALAITRGKTERVKQITVSPGSWRAGRNKS